MNVTYMQRKGVDSPADRIIAVTNTRWRQVTSNYGGEIDETEQGGEWREGQPPNMNLYGTIEPPPQTGDLIRNSGNLWKIGPLDPLTGKRDLEHVPEGGQEKLPPIQKTLYGLMLYGWTLERSDTAPPARMA